MADLPRTICYNGISAEGKQVTFQLSHYDHKLERWVIGHNDEFLFCGLAASLQCQPSGFYQIPVGR